MWHWCHDLYSLRPQSSAARQLRLRPAGTGTYILRCPVKVCGCVSVSVFLLQEHFMFFSGSRWWTALVHGLRTCWPMVMSRGTKHSVFLVQQISPHIDGLGVDCVLARLWVLSWPGDSPMACGPWQDVGLCCLGPSYLRTGHFNSCVSYTS